MECEHFPENERITSFESETNILEKELGNEQNDKEATQLIKM